ncbi:MAG: BCCT family transporter [Actinomycetota bacterium]|nr:BCCT family transporter [Actinomycetota bacterium]
MKAAWRSVLPAVFIPASIIIFGLILFSVVFSSVAENAFTNLNSVITDTVGWWYVLVVTGFVVFALYCGLSRIGTIRLGRDMERPEYGFFAWLAMLFSAGMGIGLVFYGVAEPLSHYIDPPPGLGIPGSTDAAANQALSLTMFHWGLHAWAIYVVVGLGMAYMTYRRGRPLSVRWLLEPLIGRERVEGWIGHAVDVVAIVGTLFGVATSLGFGITQISSGLQYLGWIEVNNWWTVGMIAAITAVATGSVILGVSRGIKWLSNINMGMAAGLTVFVLLLGPTLFLLQAWVQNLGNYATSLPELMLRTGPFTDGAWLGSWTIFYWGWWISWAPFVGMFIARISRGRTIRQFVIGVLLVPTVIGSLWFTVFGDSGIMRQREEGNMLVDGAIDANTSLFRLLEGLPLGVITSVIAITVIIFFFVTSSDSGSLVVDILAAGGDLDPPKASRIYWCILEGVAAAVLLVIGGSGSLTALQTASIATALPFSLVMVAACVAMFRAFRYDLATTPQFLRVSDPAEHAPTNGKRHHELSATLAGFVAVHQIDADTVQVHEQTGKITVAEPVDPLGEGEGDFEDHKEQPSTPS